MPHTRAYVLTRETDKGMKIVAVVTSPDRAIDWVTSPIPGTDFHMTDLDPDTIPGEGEPE